MTEGPNNEEDFDLEFCQDEEYSSDENVEEIEDMLVPVDDHDEEGETPPSEDIRARARLKGLQMATSGLKKELVDRLMVAGADPEVESASVAEAVRSGPETLPEFTNDLNLLTTIRAFSQLQDVHQSQNLRPDPPVEPSRITG